MNYEGVSITNIGSQDPQTALNTAAIAVNTSGISTNATNIATNVTNITANETDIERNRTKSGGFEARRNGTQGLTLFTANAGIVNDGQRHDFYQDGCGGNGSVVDIHSTFGPGNANDFLTVFTPGTEPKAMYLVNPQEILDLGFLFDIDYTIGGAMASSQMTFTTFLQIRGEDAAGTVYLSERRFEMTQTHNDANRSGKRRSSPIRYRLDLLGYPITKLYFTPSYTSTVTIPTGTLTIGGVVDSDRAGVCALQVTVI